MRTESISSYTAAEQMHGLEATELRLGIPGMSSSLKTKLPLDKEPTTTKRCIDRQEEGSSTSRSAKSQIVGWPPLQAFWRNARCDRYQDKASPATIEPPTATPTAAPTARSSALLVKVSFDGAPYLRKIDLGAYKGYTDLRLALDAMICSSFSLSTASHRQLTYEDKDGDWMLVGDVPWEMFVACCNRLRIVKASSDEHHV